MQRGLAAAARTPHPTPRPEKDGETSASALGLPWKAHLLTAFWQIVRHFRRLQKPFGILPAAERPTDRQSSLVAITLIA